MTEGDDYPDTNASSLSGTDEVINIASVAIYSIITVVGMIGNGLVIYVTGFKMKTTVNSVWFLNLALADFLFTAFLIFTTISLAQHHLWPFGPFMCKLNKFVTVVSMFASIFFLTAISMDRCLSTWVVVWAQNKRTVCKAKLISVIIWVLAAVCSIPYAVLIQTDKNGYCNYTDDESTHKKVWILSLFRLIMGFAIPFVVIFFCYVAIGVRAGRLHGVRKRRSRRIIFSIIIAFFLCWLPFHIVQLIDIIDPSTQHMAISYIAGPLTVSLAFLNSCLNPILYVFMCDEFQKKLKKSICFVLESALAEDQLSYMSSRSLSSHLSRISRKSGSVTPMEIENKATSLNATECKVFINEASEMLSID
ncbi:C3a anaphylatoxin chemotactic receptor-like isoform X2 [Betta splendens]|uniref:C3a anaphylatoxin chemotactic receptor-like isoform X2 n=1 Tax=Betta splendens TaxID=158456 RepID=A0A6P7KYK6_BETSP|nr:C3a anaphylatoxin chemotactic receptor-like isoform X2 [Betta splendens]